MKELLVFAAIIAAIGWLFFGWFKPVSYTAYFYPDRDNYDYKLEQSGLKDLTACQDWVAGKSAQDSDGSYDYICGKNCTYRENYGEVICETKER